MINLIRNEMTKIFSKKLIYVILFIVLILGIISNIFTLHFGDKKSDGAEFSEFQLSITNAKDRLDEKDIENWRDARNIQINSKIFSDYSKDSIMSYLVRHDGELNEITFKLASIEAEAKADSVNNKKDFDKLLKDNPAYAKQQKILKEKLDKLSKVTQKGYLESEKKKMEAALKSDPNDKEALINKEVLKLRESEKIDYKTDYLNYALEDYATSYASTYNEDFSKKDLTKLSLDQRAEWSDKLEQFKDKKINEYMIKNKINLKEEKNSKENILDAINGFKFVLLFTLIIIAGSIVAEEYNKGTIKKLLLKPYSRSKILLAKLISVVITSVILYIAMAIIVSILGIIFFGFNSLTDPVVTFNYNTLKLEEHSLFASIILGLNSMPSTFIFVLMAFAGSVIFASSAGAIIFAFLANTGVGILNAYLSYKMNDWTWLEYVPTLHWNPSYVWGEQANNLGLTPGYTIFVMLATYTILIVSSFIVFKNKDIKNQ